MSTPTAPRETRERVEMGDEHILAIETLLSERDDELERHLREVADFLAPLVFRKRIVVSRKELEYWREVALIFKAEPLVRGIDDYLSPTADTKEEK